MNISRLLITPLSRESIARLVITPTASPVSGIDQVTVSRVATPFGGIARLIISALSVLLVGLVLLVGSATAQNVGDFIINEKTTSTGRVTLRSWPKGANTLWGTDANGLPQKIILGAGLSLGSGSLIATAPSSISWSSVTGKPSTFPPDAHTQAISTISGLQASLDAKLSTSAAASTYAPLSHTQAISTISGLQAALDGKVSAVEPSIESALTITDINDPANNGSELNGIIIRSNRESQVQHQQQIIFGNGDKTGRIVAPALVDDYVWTLPQATGRVMLDSDNSGGLDASRLTSGTVASARLPTTIAGLTSVTSATFVGALTGTASGNLVSGGALGTPSSGVLTNCTGIPAANLTGTINTARIGTGTANSTTYLRGDGTWSAVTGGVTAVTGTAGQITVTGTTAPVLSLPSTITGLTSVTSTAFVGSLTGTASGNATLGANTFTGSQTLSSGRLSVASLSSAASPALGLTDAGATGFFSDSNGVLYYGGTSRGHQFAWIANGLFRVGYSGFIEWTSGAANAAADLRLGREAANHLAQRNGTAAQRLMVANTYTSTTNNEVAVIDWQTTTNTLRIGSDKGSGGGSNRPVQIIMGGTAKITLDTSGNVILSGLPTSASGLPSGALWRDDVIGGVIKQVP